MAFSSANLCSLAYEQQGATLDHFLVQLCGHFPPPSRGHSQDGPEEMPGLPGKGQCPQAPLFIGRADGGPRAIARCKGKLEQALAHVARKPREQLRVLIPRIKFWGRLD